MKNKYFICNNKRYDMVSVFQHEGKDEIIIGSSSEVTKFADFLMLELKGDKWYIRNSDITVELKEQ